MSFPPEIYLIGAQKSGTTTLAYLLSQHPNICVCEPKEPHFFSTNWSKGWAWYQDKFFEHKDAVCVDASTTYSMAPLNTQERSSDTRKHLQGVPQRIYSVNPKAKFIYIMRDPVERTYSGYWHRFTNGREQQEFGEAIKHDSFYLDVSDYYGQLQLWLEYFPIESFLFLLFEDMKQNPEKAARDCFDFIEVNLENVQIQLEEARNKSKHVNAVGRQFNGLFKSLDRSGFGYVAPSVVRRVVNQMTVDPSRSRPRIQEKDRTFLCEYFFEKRFNLEFLTGLSLSQWQV